MSEDKVHNIKTIRDILSVVNAKNIDNFLIDFSAWLKMRKSIDEISEIIKEDVEVHIEDNETFHWINDGKNEMNIKVTVE